MQPSCVRCRFAFSLVELLVATSVATMLMLILAGVSSQVSKLLTTGISQNQNRVNARAAMSFMAKELKQASIAKQKTFTVGTTPVSALHLVINPSSVTERYKNPDAVFWQAPIATTTTSGDIAEVGYFVYRDEKPDVTGKRVFHSDLMRLFVNPTDTTNYRIYSQPGSWLDGGLLDKFIPTRLNNYQGLFLENVIGLWVIPFKDNGRPMNTVLGPNTEMTTNHDYDSRHNNITSAPIDRLPSMVQVSLLVADSTTIKRLSGNITVTGFVSADECFAALKASSSANARLLVTGAEVVYFNVALDNY